MTIKPSDLLELARDLTARATETALRSATSRAYYAGHHRCDELCTLLGIPKPSNRWTRKHEGIIDTMERFSDKEASRQQKLREIGTLLRQCRDMRIRADYDLKSAYDAEQAEITIATVESLETLVAQISI